MLTIGHLDYDQIIMESLFDANYTTLILVSTLAFPRYDITDNKSHSRYNAFHFQLSFFGCHSNHALIIHMISALSREKNKKNKKIFWHDICYAEFGTRFAVACHFGSFGPRPAILAVPLP
jgi:CRISPR/Cas system-associated endoribonuclease Cas2